MEANHGGALRTNRRSVSIEIDRNWCDTISNRLKTFKQLPKDNNLSSQILMKGSVQKIEEQTLFDCTSIKMDL